MSILVSIERGPSFWVFGGFFFFEFLEGFQGFLEFTKTQKPHGQIPDVQPFRVSRLNSHASYDNNMVAYSRLSYFNH
jgi:hypothetical protein